MSRNNDPRGNSMREYQRLRRDKLNQRFQRDYVKEDLDQAHLFQDVTIFVNGHTVPSQLELKSLMGRHGGHMEYYFTKGKVTHMIASELPDGKFDQLRNVPVVRPEWILESIKAKMVLPTAPYVVNATKESEQPCITAAYARVGTPTVDKPLDVPERDQGVSDHVQDVDQAFDAVIQSAAQSAQAEPPGPVPLPEGTGGDDGPAKHTQAPGSNSAAASTPFPYPHSTLEDEHFASNYWQTSRLSFLSTFKMKLKELVAERARQGGFSSEIAKMATDQAGASGLLLLDTAETTNSNGDDWQLLEDDEDMGDGPLAPGREGESNQGHLGRPTDLAQSQMSLILHIDMDCFFASVAQATHPHLKGKPVAIAHAQRFGEIASASYEARAFGVHNGSWCKRALERCPDLVVMPYQFEDYKRISLAIYDIFYKYTNKVEAVSCDEALLEIHVDTRNPAERAVRMAESIREDIFAVSGCTASAGIGRNILLARLATSMAKPNGVHFIPLGQLASFLAPLPVRKLPGVGYRWEKLLEKNGMNTVGDICQHDLTHLQTLFGPQRGLQLYKSARGVDDRKLRPIQPRKTVGVDVTWGVRFETHDQVEGFISQLAGEVSNRLMQADVKGRQIMFKLLLKLHGAGKPGKKLGHGPCSVHQKLMTLPYHTRSKDIITAKCMSLYSMLKVEDATEVRGIGISVSRLDNDQSVGEVPANTKPLTQFFAATEHEPELRLKSDDTLIKERENEVIPPPKGGSHLDVQPATSVGSDSASSSGDSLRLRAQSLLPPEDMPAMSQIDPEWKAALPPDVLKEFETNYRQRQRIKPPKDYVDDNRNAMARPGRLSDLARDLNSVVPSSYSQLDKAILAELPANLQLEITEQYRVKRLLEESERMKANGERIKRQRAQASSAQVDITVFARDRALRTPRTNYQRLFTREPHSYCLDAMRVFLSSGLEPKPLHGDLFVAMTSQWIENCELDRVKTSLALLRHETRQRPVWRPTYEAILSRSQQVMLKRHGIMLTF